MNNFVKSDSKALPENMLSWYLPIIEVTSLNHSDFRSPDTIIIALNSRDQN